MFASAPSLVLLLALLVLLNIPRTTADTLIDFGEAYSYAILANTSITFIDGDDYNDEFVTTHGAAPIVNGDMGVYPGTSVTGWVTLNGVLVRAPTNVNTPSLIAASIDVQGALNAISLLDVIAGGGSEIGGRTFTPGTYKFNSVNVAMDHVVTLDGLNQPSPVWTFKTGGDMVFASRAKMVFRNFEGNANHVTWQ
ncbi:hypothetical protein B484DRAFT_436859, partial [Ochromonadaceae sp. CCMP2298]